MPDWRTLKPGDRVRIVAIPLADRFQAEREATQGLPDAHITVYVLQRLVDSGEIVEIAHIDDYGQPWFDYDFHNDDGELEQHSLNITDELSWEFVEPPRSSESQH